MSADGGKGTTAVLAEEAAGFRLEHAPDAIVDRMKALVLDLLRVVAVGACRSPACHTQGAVFTAA
jgi:hypothetical protein